MKIIANNKKAFFDYFIEETYEAGIVLAGSEVKSVRLGGVSFLDSYVSIKNDEAFIVNMNIKPYEKGSFFNVEAKRERKLLLNKAEILKLKAKVAQKGYSVVPTKVYFKDNFVKVEIGLAKGKHSYDKKQVLAIKDKEREMKREIKDFK
jgi:SsrA-binding protein